MNIYIRICSLFKVIHYLCSINFYYMKHLLSKQQAEIILEPYFLKIQEAIEGGFNKFSKINNKYPFVNVFFEFFYKYFIGRL